MKKKNASGFTLIELLITIVVAGILLALAVPAFHSFVQNNRIASQTNELVTALALARSEAIKRKEEVTVCASSTGTSCTGNWAQGWLAFLDTDNNGIVNTTVGSTETVLRVWDGMQGGATITPDTGTSLVVFDRLGGADNTVIFQLRIPKCTGSQARNLTLRTTGSVETIAVNC